MAAPALLSSAQRALAIPEIVGAVVANALSLQACEAEELRLVNKLFNDQADAIIWEDIWMCDYGKAYGPEGRTHFNLQAMLKRRPNLCLYLKHANLEMSGPHLEFRLSLIPKARNLSWLSINGLSQLAAHYAQNHFTLPKLKGLRIDVAPLDGGDEAARREMQQFLQSLTAVRSLSVFTMPYKGDFFPWSSYNLVDLLDGTGSPGPGITPQIEVFGLLLSPITMCTGEDLDSLFKTFRYLRGVRIDIPPEIDILHLVHLLPNTLEKVSIRCGLETIRSILQDLEDVEQLPRLRTLPILDLHGVAEVPGFGVSTEVVNRFMGSMSKRKDIQITASDSDRLYGMVTDEELGPEDSNSSGSDSGKLLQSSSTD